MASKKELRALITLAGKIDPSLQSAMLKATGESMKLSQSLKSSAKNMNQVGVIAKGTFLGSLASRAFSSIVSNIKTFSSESINLASDLKEVQNVVDTTFSQSSKTIDAWAKQALDAYGLSELQAKNFTGTMGAMLKSSGIVDENLVIMSRNLTALAGDIASFYNLDPEEAFEKIRSGLSGQTAPLKQLGINMSVANLEAHAMSKGIKASWQQLDEGSQAMLRYSYLMSVTKDSQGDFVKTYGEFANQQRLWDTNLRQLAATLLEKALPHLAKYLQKANEFVKNLDVEKTAEYIGLAFGKMGDAMGWVKDNSYWLIPAVSGLAGSLAALQVINTVTGLMKLWKASTFAQTLAQHGLNAALIANPIGLIVVGIGLAIAAGVALYKNWDKIVLFWRERVLPVFSKVGEFFGGIWDGVVAGFKGYINLWIKMANFLIGNLNKISFKTPDWVPSWLGGGKTFGISIAPLPTFGKGGVAYQPSIFGEAGPEMAIPLQRTPRSLGLLDQAARMLGVSSPGRIEINYAPIIYGGSRSEIEPLLQKHKEELKMMIEDIFADKGRVAFG